MKIRKIILILIVVLTLTITGCGKKTKGKLSNYVIDDSKISLSIKKDTLTKTGATIIMENKTDEKFNYGAVFHLEKKYNKKWYIVEPINEINFTVMPYEIGPKQTKEIKFDWEYGYGSLSKGKYRLVKYMYKLGSESIDETKKTYVAAQFQIK